MGDTLRLCYSPKKLEAKAILSKKQPVDSSNCFSRDTLKSIASMKQGILEGTAGIGLFIVKTAALEIVRRYSRAKCPVIWEGLQAFQVLCHLPFKWIQTWTPLRALVKYVQTFSRPFLFLTIATALSDQSPRTTDKVDGLHDPEARPELQQEHSSQLSTAGSRSHAEVSDSVTTKKWLQELQTELEKQDITLPEWFKKDDLLRFYDAANGVHLKFISSIKKTIRWRQTYKFLSPEELEAWSHLIFWHGYDLQQRPCLIIQLGLACLNLRSVDRTVFAKAVVSQIEYRLLHLVDVENPHITVLMDCKGLTPFGFPMQMIRSCAMLLQDHYPNRLGYMIVIRLPLIAQMITQTLFQIMRPATQQKLRILGGNYQRALPEYLQTIPSFLGGRCSCLKCSDQANTRNANEEEMILKRPIPHIVENVASPELPHLVDIPRVNQNSDQTERVAVIGILIVWILIVFVLVRHYSEFLSVLYWPVDP